MESDIIVRKVTQDVLLFVWFKHGALEEEPVRDIYDLIPEISAELMINLSASVWIESFRTLFIWESFFEKHFERMTSSPKLFANYVSYVCYILNDGLEAHECFFDILSFVTDVSIRCLENTRNIELKQIEPEKDYTRYLNTCVDLFCAFFEKELRTKFEKQGGWKKLNIYLEKQYNIIESKSRMCEDSPAELFKYFQVALERGNRSDRADECGVVYKKRNRPHYIVNGIVIKDISQLQVETHEKATDFAEFIMNKLEKLLLQTFHETTMEFCKTCNQVKELYQWQFDKHARKEEQFSPKIQNSSESIYFGSKDEKNTLQSNKATALNRLEIRNLGTLDIQDDSATVKSCKQILSKGIRTKNMLNKILEIILKIFNLFQVIYGKHKQVSSEVAKEQSLLNKD